MELKWALENSPCAECGMPAVAVVDGVAWCDGCFHEMGSCCAGAEEEP